MSKIKLKVAEAHQDDVNKGIVRVDSDIVRNLGVVFGEVIGIKADEKQTLAVVERPYPSDLNLGIIRMDGTTRKNAKISVGETVEIFKPRVVEASKVTLSPLQEFPTHPVILENLRVSLQNKAFSQGDIISVNSGILDSGGFFADSHQIGNEIFKLLGGNFNQVPLKFKVQVAKPQEFVYVSAQTQIEISSQDKESSQGVNYEDIGGLKSQLEKIRELVELPLRHPEIFKQLGIEPPRGILLFGPPGTGKTLLARAIANETEANFFSISAPEIVNKFYGESEKKLRELFERAQKESPSVIFIDELDAIATKREETQGEVEKRIVAQLLTLMDGLNKSNKLIVIAATNRPDSIDEALRRPGRFDRELEIGIPKEEDRLEILQIHTRGMPLELSKEFKIYETEITKYKQKNNSSDIDIVSIKKAFSEDIIKGLAMLPNEVLEQIRKKQFHKSLLAIAKVTHGFVGADLEALVKEAAFNVLRRTFPQLTLSDEEIPQEILQGLEITKEDFTQALKVIRPSGMRELLVEVPNVKWKDIGGLENIKQQMIEMIEWPLTHSKAFSRLGISAPKGILMYGPPGTGKTLLAKAVATETSCNFIYIKGPEIINKYVGESEKTIRKVFEKARQNSPSIIFFDEFDAISQTRMGKSGGGTGDKIVNQILTELDGLEELMSVKVLAATNRPKFIDPALLRPGRFDKLVLVDMPDEKARESILQVHTQHVPIANKKEVIKEISIKTQGYVGADLEAVVREAGLIALREDVKIQELSKEYFIKALEVIKPSVTPELQEFYSEVEQEMKNPKKTQESLSMSSYM